MQSSLGAVVIKLNHDVIAPFTGFDFLVGFVNLNGALSMHRTGINLYGLASIPAKLTSLGTDHLPPVLAVPSFLRLGFPSCKFTHHQAHKDCNNTQPRI